MARRTTLWLISLLLVGCAGDSSSSTDAKASVSDGPKVSDQRAGDTALADTGRADAALADGSPKDRGADQLADHAAGADQSLPADQGLAADQTSSSPQLLINEVFYDQLGSDGPGAFIELWGEPNLSLNGYTLRAMNGNSLSAYGEIPLTGKTHADGFYLVVHSQSPSTLLAKADLQDDLADLQNGPDALQLLAPDGEIIDALAYGAGVGSLGEGDPAVDVPAGKSLSRDEQHSDTDDNSADFTAAWPSPGAASSPGCVPDCAGRSCGPDPVCGESCGSCADGQRCQADQCVDQPEFCQQDSDCGVGNHCTPATLKCSSNECEDAIDCALGETCDSGQCVFVPIGATCTLNQHSECGNGRKCHVGICELWTCATLDDCNDVAYGYKYFGATCTEVEGYKVCLQKGQAPCNSHGDCGIGYRCDPRTYRCDKFSDDFYGCPCSKCYTCVNDRCLPDQSAPYTICAEGLGRHCYGNAMCAADGFCREWGCYNNTECPFGTACQQHSVSSCNSARYGGVCWPMWYEPCDASTNCGVGLSCVSSKCRPSDSCSSSADCAERFGCPSVGDHAGECTPWNQIECQADIDCPLKSSCLPTPAGRRCSAPEL